MAKSLQDQLLKAGVVDEKKSKKIKQQKRKEKKLVKQGLVQPDDIAELARKHREEEANRNRELNKQRQAEAEQRALRAQARQLIAQHRIVRPEEGVMYQFVDGTTIKRICVSALQQEQLANGQLAIVRSDDKYEAVPANTAKKIKERWTEAVIVLNERPAEPSDEDDPYADYQIPDDLMW